MNRNSSHILQPFDELRAGAAQDKRPESTGFRRVTPWQQLWELLSEEQQQIVRMVFRRLKKRDQEDLCYAMIAYIRYHIIRDFPSPFMQVIYLSFIDLVENKYSSANINIKNP